MGVCQPPISTFCEIGVSISPLGHRVYTTIGERLVTRDKPLITVDEVAILAKGMGVAKVLAVELGFPPHPHIKNDVLSSDVKLESVPSIPQSLARVSSIGNLFPIPIPKGFLILYLGVVAQAYEHHPKHLNRIHFLHFLSFRCTNIIPWARGFVNPLFDFFFGGCAELP